MCQLLRVFDFEDFKVFTYRLVVWETTISSWVRDVVWGCIAGGRFTVGMEVGVPVVFGSGDIVMDLRQFYVVGFLLLLVLLLLSFAVSPCFIILFLLVMVIVEGVLICYQCVWREYKRCFKDPSLKFHVGKICTVVDKIFFRVESKELKLLKKG